MSSCIVPHSGESSFGEFVFSLNLTDILSGWVETQAVMGKGQAGVVSAIEKLSERIPFKVLGIDSDNVLNLESSFFFGYTDPFIPSTNNQQNPSGFHSVRKTLFTIVI